MWCHVLYSCTVCYHGLELNTNPEVKSHMEHFRDRLETGNLLHVICDRAPLCIITLSTSHTKKGVIG